MIMTNHSIFSKNTLTVSEIFRQSFTIVLSILVVAVMPGFPMAQAQDVAAAKEPVTEPSASSMTPESSSEVTLPTCTLSPIEVPTLPDKIPGYTELDPDTQLHVTGTPQVIDLQSYTLEITGKVKHSLKLTYNNLRCMPKIEASPTLICPGFFQDTASWAGVPLQYVLELAGLEEDAERLRLVSVDKYATSVSIEDALSDKNFLAYEWEGEPIPILHGFPVRAIFPELQGNKWVKWLVKIEVQ